MYVNDRFLINNIYIVSLVSVRDMNILIDQIQMEKLKENLICFFFLRKLFILRDYDF